MSFIAKDNSVWLHLLIKAIDSPMPLIPLLHVDAGWKFLEMIAGASRPRRWPPPAGAVAVAGQPELPRLCRQCAGLLRRGGRAGEVATFTAIDSPYEVSEHDDVVLKTGESSPAPLADQLVKHLMNNAN